MVFAWKDIANHEARNALESLMYNIGLEALGERGQVVLFDGRKHETEDPIDANQPVFVVDPGWQLTNSRGVYLICKTRVKKQGTE